jgi:hypothetical protein
MTIRNFVILGALSLALAGCGTKIASETELQGQPQQETTTAPAPVGEDMMQQNPSTPSTPVDVSTDASLKSAAKLKSSDDASSLKTDLDSTTVVNEDFK